jgi:DNA primase
MSRIDQAELDDLKSRTLLSAVFEKYGIKSKGGRNAKWAVCCFHAEKSGSLKINDERGRYHCFGCGAAGDHFTVLTELGGKTFMEAVEVLGGVRLITVEERQAIEVRNNEWQEEERKAVERTRKSIQHTFATGKPIAGTAVEEYLKGRGLRAGKYWTFDLRFLPDLIYRGFTTRRPRKA